MATLTRVEAVLQNRALICAALFVCTLFVYLKDAEYRLRGQSGDTDAAQLLPLSLLGDGDLDLDEFVRSGESRSYAFTHVRGRTISSYPIIPGILNTPVYVAAQLVRIDISTWRERALLSMVSASLMVAVSVVFFYLTAAELFRGRTALVGTLLYAFGTTAFSVAARGIWQHGPSLLLITLALWLLVRRGDVSTAFAGLFLGFAIFNRPVNLLIVAPLALYVAYTRRLRITIAFAVCALIPLLLMLWYSQHYWGSITTLGQYPLQSGGRSLFQTNAFASALIGLLVSPARGLLIFTPVFIFSLLAVPFALFRFREQPLFAALAAGIVLTLPLYASWYSWWGGSCFGYRLLTELVPALVLLAAWASETLFRRTTPRVAMVLLAIPAFYVHFLGAMYAPCGADYEPTDINSNPERLWVMKDSEIARCSVRFLDRLNARLTSH